MGGTAPWRGLDNIGNRLSTGLRLWLRDFRPLAGTPEEPLASVSACTVMACVKDTSVRLSKGEARFAQDTPARSDDSAIHAALGQRMRCPYEDPWDESGAVSVLSPRSGRDSRSHVRKRVDKHGSPFLGAPARAATRPPMSDGMCRPLAGAQSIEA